MIRMVCVLAATMLLSPGMTMADTWTERTVSIDGGPAPLRGTLTMPAGTDAVDAVLIHPGSGPVDRDGNNFLIGDNNSLSLLARSLADRGIASLRIDKRGIGESAKAAPDERDLRFDIYADDAVQWLDFLEVQPRIRRLFLIGHSEGALVATLAAQRKPVSGVILIAGTGRSVPALLREQFAVNLPTSLQTPAATILQKLERGETVAGVPAALAAEFRPSIQPYLISLFGYDPAAELAKLHIPTQIVQGTRDIQVSTDDAERLAAARGDARLVIVEDMSHVLKIAPADRAGNIRLYADPGVPLAPTLVPAIADFIRAE